MHNGWPSDEGQITRSWLSVVLSESMGKTMDVVSFSKERIGTGQVGECWRLKLVYAEPWVLASSMAETRLDAPSSLIVKVAASDPASRAAGHSQSCYTREIGFYQDLQSRVRVRTPRCYFSAIDANETDHILLLEDLTPALQGDQLSGCSVEVASMALEQLSLLQGPLWRDQTLDAIEWLEKPSLEVHSQVRALYGHLYCGFLDRFSARLSTEANQVARWLGDHLDDLSTGEPVLCPVHNDFRLDNLLFGDGVSAPLVTVVDWQTIRLGSGPRDAAYFLGGGLTTETRRKHERRLVEETYYRSLVAAGATDFDFAECWKEYRLGAFGGLIMAVIASMLVETTERGDEMFLTMARRHARHALDLETMSIALEES